MPAEPLIRAKGADDAPWLIPFMETHWGGDLIHVRGVVRSVLAMPGLVAEVDGRIAGLLHYEHRDRSCEIVTLNAVPPGRGIGTRLVDEVARLSTTRGLVTMSVTTTNDNLKALGFYQRRGFHLSALRCGAVDRARIVKTTIPWHGANGIRLRDELDLIRELPTEDELG